MGTCSLISLQKLITASFAAGEYDRPIVESGMEEKVGEFWSDEEWRFTENKRRPDDIEHVSCCMNVIKVHFFMTVVSKGLFEVIFCV